MGEVQPAKLGGIAGRAERLEVRRALRSSLADLADESLVLIACSGGPDSLALALAAGDEVRSGRARYRFGAVVVDHGLQPDSAEVAARAAEACIEAGLDPVEVMRVEVRPDSDGPEAAARTARRAALLAAADRRGAVAVLLAHTRDDQAETVLLRLARGSGARSLSGMAPVTGPWRRPLLGLPRSVVHASLGSTDAWADPHNVDPAYARSRVRAEALPALVSSLGPDVVDGLARTASLLRDDADALEAWADDAWAAVCLPNGDAQPGVTLDIDALAALPRALRTRLVRRAAIEAGAPAGALTREHVLRVEALVSDWRGQGSVDVPGLVSAGRAYGRLEFRRIRPQP